MWHMCNGIKINVSDEIYIFLTVWIIIITRDYLNNLIRLRVFLTRERAGNACTVLRALASHQCGPGLTL